MKEKTILHSDVNNFFASVECSTNPNLLGKPVAVTGNPEKRTGIILAKNELAKKYGVKTGEAIWQAKQKCPDLVTVGPHYALYEKISKEIQELYLEYTDLIEPMGLDECWLDITPSLKYLNKTGKEVADELRSRIKEKFGITVSVGVSFSKLFAKLGSDLKKPDATTEITRENFKERTYHLPLNSIIGIGRKNTQKFEKMNVVTIGDFVSLNESFVTDIMGKPGKELHQKLRGDASEDVESYYNPAPPKSIGNGTTTVVDIKSREDIEKVVAFLCEKIANRMENGNYLGSCVSFAIKTNDFKTTSHSKAVPAMRSNEDIFKQSMFLIDEFWKYDKPIRSIRIQVSNLQPISHTEQLSFLTEETNNLNKSIQSIKDKYGSNKIYLASDTYSFINRKNEDEDRPENH